jgi:hypothetical protein
MLTETPTMQLRGKLPKPRIFPEWAVTRYDWKAYDEAAHLFRCGKLSESEYLATTGTSRFKQFYAHYRVGFFRLALGDRPGAREQFQKAVSSPAYWDLRWFESQTLLGRLKDEAWPPWIPAKKSESKP